VFDQSLNGNTGGFHILPSQNMPTQSTETKRTAALWAPYNYLAGNAWIPTGIAASLAIETGNNGVKGWVEGMASSDFGQACDITVFRTVGSGQPVNVAPTAGYPGDPTFDFMRRIRGIAGDGGARIALPFSFTFFDFPDAGQPPQGVRYEIFFRSAINAGGLAYINRTPVGEPTGSTAIHLQEAQGQ
jgi:hypothetical protein